MNKNESSKSVKPAVTLVVAIVLALSLVGSVGAGTAFAKAYTFTDNFQIPITLYVFVPCAANGMGEDVELSGSLHVLFHTTIDDRGGFHAKTHFQPQGISGVGLTTGDKYQATGVTQDTFNGKVGVEYTYVNNFKIIGAGPGNNFLIHETFHYTIDANGRMTAWVDNFSVECK